MKQFTKRAAMVFGLLCTALLCMGIVYIDNISHYWRVGGASGQYVQLIVSNRFIPFSVNTNTGRIGINSSNANTVSIDIVGLKPDTNATGNGSSAVTTGRIVVTAGAGGDTFATTSASGGTGGNILMIGGAGGNAPLATTNHTGGTGSGFSLTGGSGGGAGGVATNSTIGGVGGNVTLNGGAGGVPTVASTQTVALAGGNVNLTGGTSPSPTAGWSRKTSSGGQVNITGGSTGDSIRTNSGGGGTITITAGTSGNVTTAPGNPGNAGAIELLGGNGGTGDTNAFGGTIYLKGGDGGSTAQDGDVVVGRSSDGTSRGGVMVGPALGGAASITNILGGRADLDFPSTAAGLVSDLPITVTGAVSNNCAVSLSVPWQVLTANGGLFTTYSSNDTIYVRFVNNNLVTTIDPIPGNFTVVAFRIR